MNQEWLSVSQASQWATSYLDRPIKPSNISYLLQYAKLKKHLDEEKKIKVSMTELKKYYDKNVKNKYTSWNLEYPLSSSCKTFLVQNISQRSPCQIICS